VSAAAGLDPVVTTAVLGAAVTHAGWNAIAHAIKDQVVAFSLVGAGGLICGGLLAVFADVPAAAAWPYLLVSVGIHLAYQLLLMRSFQLGDFSQTYPIARGSAPLIVTVLAAVFVGERPDAWQTAGVLVACCGLTCVALFGLRGRPPGQEPPWPAIIAALGTGVTIATYTVVDGVGVRHSHTALGYTAWLLMLQGVAIPCVGLVQRRGELLRQARPVAARGIFGGALSVCAYGLVLWAQTKGALAPIAALRESSIIVGAAIGTVFFKEHFGRPRIAATLLVVAGIVLLNAG
jgi:drug/metabolite transporter (DMT)-like permease